MEMKQKSQPFDGIVFGLQLFMHDSVSLKFAWWKKHIINRKGLRLIDVINLNIVSTEM